MLALVWLNAQVMTTEKLTAATVKTTMPLKLRPPLTADQSGRK